MRQLASATRCVLAQLHGALSAGDADMVYDAFLGATLAVAQMPALLSAAEYRDVLRVLAAGRAPGTDDRVLMVVEHARRAQRAYAQASEPMDILVRDEYTALLQDAYVWNTLLSRARAPRGSHTSLEPLVDLFLAAERTVASLPAAGPQRFPDAASFNLLLYALVPHAAPRAYTQRHLRAPVPRVPPQAHASTAPLLDALRADLRRHALTPAQAAAYFEAVWDRLCVAQAPTPVSWSIRVALHARMGHWDRVRASVREACAAGACTTDVVNAALGALLRRRRRKALPAVYSVYASMRYHLLQTEREWVAAARTGGPGGRDAGAPDGRLRGGPSRRAAALPRSAVHALGVTHLPACVVPDRRTYALVIRALTLADDMDGALGVLHDMVVTPEARPGGTRAAHPPPLAPGPARAQGHPPSIDIYHSLFAAFARRGSGAIPQFAHADPTRWTWRVHEQAGAWTMHTFAELFEGYLRVTSAAQARGAAAARAPTTTHLLSVLAALRRVSGDCAPWVLSQWARVVRQFAPPPDALSGAWNPPNTNGWHGFRIDPRVQRVLEQVGQGGQRAPEGELRGGGQGALCGRGNVGRPGSR
ncbi:hypothetical protein MSPP1_002949 [Malassezia sp. CBS 17886]|nr:hypothetical protein MSPP1_002949 [Malassezia sp. CBS 17886]